MEGRLAQILAVGNVLTAFLAILSGDPSMGAWAWVFHADEPLDLQLWLPVLLTARELLLQVLHPPV
jgi:hypothetical protein